MPLPMSTWWGALVVAGPAVPATTEVEPQPTALAEPREPIAAPEDETDEADEDDDEQPILLNEVVGAEAIYPQEMAEVQLTLEASYLHRRRDRSGGLGYLVEIGATDWWQFELAWTAPLVHGRQGARTDVGLGPVELGTRWTWMNMRGSPFSAAIAFEVEISTAPDREQHDGPDEPGELAEGAVEYEPFIVLAIDPPGGRAQVFTNLGFELGDEGPAPFIKAGVIGSVSIVRPYLVVAYEREQTLLVPGASLILPRRWELMMGVPVELSWTTPAVGASLVLIYEWNPLERRSARRAHRQPRARMGDPARNASMSPTAPSKYPR